MYSALLKALLTSEATPEHEAIHLFNKITLHKTTIRRSGMRAMILLQETINGKSDTCGTALVQEALTLGVIHNNPEGVHAFLQRVRQTQNEFGRINAVYVGSRSIAGETHARHRRCQLVQLATCRC